MPHSAETNVTNYATTDEANGRAQNGDEQNERSSLLNRKPTSKPGIGTRIGRHFSQDVDERWGDLALLFCYIITGLLDSSSTSIWGSFVSMQTGNTIYVGLGLADPKDGNRWIRSGISVLSFCLGSLFFSSFHRTFGGRRRWVLVSSYAIQLAFVIGAALIVSLGPRTGKDSEVSEWVAVPLALLAFQSSGQAVISRVLHYGSLTSVVLTSIYCDLFSDARLFTAPLKENAERNRRAAAPILLLLGAVFGGLWAHSPFGMAGALWTAVVLKTFLVLNWMVWKAETDLSSE